MSEGLKVRVVIDRNDGIVITEDSGPLRLVLPIETRTHLRRGRLLYIRMNWMLRVMVMRRHKNTLFGDYALKSLFKDYVRKETGVEVESIWIHRSIGVCL